MRNTIKSLMLGAALAGVAILPGALPASARANPVQWHSAGTSTPAGNARLTNRQALAQLAAAHGPLTVGRATGSSGPSDWFAGSIKQVQVFQWALGAAQVKALL
ncbi:hypothetical protein [Streptomyces sasae]|uniref:hypothetical protein n=1 Tax=Streptomyces sasae TaxID=1266772 RepID=UPI00292FA0A3|nr:hypothetical protein [Streptomyces sasae]